jgi:hypothetical protein
MNCSCCVWSTSLCEGFFNRSYCLRCDLAIFYLGYPSAPFHAILLIVLVTQFTAVLHAGSRVYCQNFLSLCLCLSSLSRIEGPRLRSEIVVVLVDSLYAEAIEASKSRTALSDSIHKLIFTLWDTKAEARL